MAHKPSDLHGSAPDRLVVPSDCVASLTEEADHFALSHMAHVTKADVRASTSIDFAAVQSGT